MINLQFDFENKEGVVTPSVFTEPESVIEAHTIEEIEAAFCRIEEAIEKGKYVAGYMSYEAAPAFDKRFKVSLNSEMPLLMMGVFSKKSEVPLESGSLQYNVAEWKLQSDYEEYQRGIRTIHEAIEKGDTYQVNYTARLKSQFNGDDLALYHVLAKNQQSSYSAYLQFDRYSILSASPELFFRKDNEHITTKPMKGTIKRGKTMAEDHQLKRTLSQSEKDRSENVMIVDLLRNDLGRIATPGTVKVPRLFDVETYPTVHQMTSTIQGEVPRDLPFFEIFRALFPCGSITGAPKIRTMDYISALEQSPRDVYCGAIGMFTPEREAIFNVPIRTVWIDREEGTATYGAGGGITWESTSKGEFDELWVKAKLLTEKRPSFQLLETIRLEEGEYFLMDHHLKRMKDSAIYFQYPWPEREVSEKLAEIKEFNGRGLYKVRLLVSDAGDITAEAVQEEVIEAVMKCKLASSSINEEDPFLYHKTTHRSMYNKHKDQDFFSVLLWNTKGELTEFLIGNLVLFIDGEYVTPPVESGLLAGTYREYLLEEGMIGTQTLYMEDLKRADEVWMINGLKKWVQVELVR
ncbi:MULTISPECIES: aminodeoxychorismate synthase component I [Pontibacillus]|uniref:Aminodeoxychorismate synthase component I n=1 Tax=Pontibacillus chungwhensis TaxID=265426 RepID=A0ABY8UT29_9BACI|nr:MULTISPECIES: aminodeoxychorismate synthase component I [Pontibacillus]MCD5323096.1 aminodeoxychorismate synthase component I [Pontibacillus sp. HN14]WIF96485.1 aminodeoxychorismate synthase component I [Pontibacillus chungwhensis]